MGTRAPRDVREQRARVIRPLFEQMDWRGIQYVWLANQLQVPSKRLWSYKSGEARIPPWFIERACQAVGVTPSLITIPEPRALYVQQPRKASTVKPAKAKKPAKQQKRTATR